MTHEWAKDVHRDYVRRGISMAACFNDLQAMARKKGLEAPSIDTLYRWQRQLRKEGLPKMSKEQVGLHEKAIPLEAQRALNDFPYFQRRYFGRISTPWQAEAAEQVVRLLEDEEESYAVINAPPGSGKSTCFTMDIPAWLTCRNRAIRGLVGSETANQARWYLSRLKREFERRAPLKSNPDEVARGLAVDAEATLSGDFGAFRPDGTDKDIWRADEIVVLQADGERITEKESTWTAAGKDTSFLGGRFNICIWDDLVSPRNMGDVDKREGLQQFWTLYAETRLEPGGLLVLQGQRIMSDDLYRFALDMQSGADADDDDEPEVVEGDDRVDVESGVARKYHHIKFKAHYDELCRGLHKRNDPPYGEGGCLLVPRRLTWPKLRALQRNAPETFFIQYQQEEVAVGATLVDPLWVRGGRGNDGVEYPGCWDNDRGLGELPRGIAREGLVSVATADPSPTRFWSVQWWVYDPKTEFRFLMDLVRVKMDAPEFLDWDYKEASFTGLMEDWQVRSQTVAPISHWIVEANAAQRFILQYDHARRWQAKWGVDVIAHQTHRNKSDPEYGVQALGPHWRWGRVRLPGAWALPGEPAPGRVAALKLVNEVTKWPRGSTDDCVMAQWFLEWNLPNIYVPVSGSGRSQWRPSWLTGERGLTIG